jgi:hypothetical protein
MYTKLLISGICLLFVSCSTTVKTVKTQYRLEYIQKIDSFPGIKKDFLYDKSMSFIARKYNSIDDVVKFNDKEYGQIVLHAIGADFFDTLTLKSFDYTMVIDVKDEKMRITFENIYGKQNGSIAGPDLYDNWDVVSKHLTDWAYLLFQYIKNESKDW